MSRLDTPARVRPGRHGAAIALLVLAAGGCGGGAADSGGGVGPVPPPPAPVVRPTLAPDYRPSGRTSAGDVAVHLFEWRWADIASECENVLGPAGYAAVQVSPPQEHALVTLFPWWQRYQPVSYALTRSRSGSETEFTGMVARCRAAGVAIYVDVVLNHMTAGAGTGSAGTTYTKYEYPGLWTAADFHAPCGVTNYQDAANVQDCELLGLADLNTGRASVRQRLADYLVVLARLGVAGFRIDAAKHMQPVQLDQILALANQRLAAEGRALPYVFAEVIDYGGEAVKAGDYFGLGFGSGGAADITEFKVRGIADKFRRVGTQRVGDLAQFSQAAWGLIPSDKAVVFLENHDTARETSSLTYREPVRYRLAMTWLLGQPYGYPSVYSGYAFNRGSTTGNDMGPPSDAQGNTQAVRCAGSLETIAFGDWTCEHRDPVVRAMVAFRKVVAGTDAARQWTDGANAVAYSRGDRGFVAINANDGRLDAAIPTGLPAGSYCDVLTGGRAGPSCVGTTVVVSPAGVATVALPAGTALAIHSGTRL